MGNGSRGFTVLGEERPKLWTRDFVFICFANLLLFLNLHSLTPTLPIYIEVFGGRSDAAGFPLAAISIGAVLIRPFSGWALDRYGRKPIFLCGIILFLIPALVYIWMLPAYLVIVMRFLQGLGWGVANNGANTVASDIIPLRRIGEGMGFFSMTLTLPMAIAPAAALWLVESYSFPTLFSLTPFLIVFALALALLIRYPQQITQKKREIVFMNKDCLKPAIVMLMFTLPYSATLSFLPVYAREQGIQTTGLFFTAMSLTTLLIRPAVGVFIDKLGKRGYDLAVGLGSLAICISLIILAQTTVVYHIIWGGVFFGIGFGMAQPTLLALCIISTTPEKKGAANGTYWTAYDLGLATGSVLCGFISAALGYKNMYYINIIPMIAALLIYFWKNRQTTNN